MRRDPVAAEIAYERRPRVRVDAFEGGAIGAKAAGQIVGEALEDLRLELGRSEGRGDAGPDGANRVRKTRQPLLAP